MRLVTKFFVVGACLLALFGSADAATLTIISNGTNPGATSVTPVGQVCNPFGGGTCAFTITKLGPGPSRSPAESFTRQVKPENRNDRVVGSLSTVVLATAADTVAEGIPGVPAAGVGTNPAGTTKAAKRVARWSAPPMARASQVPSAAMGTRASNVGFDHQASWTRTNSSTRCAAGRTPATLPRMSPADP